MEGTLGPHTQLVVGVSGNTRDKQLPGACPEDKGLFWSLQAKNEAQGVKNNYSAPLAPSASDRRNSCHLKAWCSPAKTLGRDNCKRPWPMHRPFSIGQRRLNCNLWADHAFWWGGWWNLMWPSQMMPSWRGQHLRRAPRRMNQGTHPSGDPSSSHHWGAKGYPGARVRSPSQSMRSRGANWRTGHCKSASWWTCHFDSLHRGPHCWIGCFNGPCQGASWRARHNPVQCEKGEKGEVPHSNFPGWMEVLHPTRPVILAGWTPLTLSKLRQQCSSQTVGGRRAQHWWAKECKRAMQEESDSMLLPGSPEPRPEVAPLPGFKEVATCLMRESPSPTPIDPPETRQPDVLMGPIVAMMYTTYIV